MMGTMRWNPANNAAEFESLDNQSMINTEFGANVSLPHMDIEAAVTVDSNPNTNRWWSPFHLQASTPAGSKPVTQPQMSCYQKYFLASQPTYC
jgi:hypothetical protein